MKNTLSVMGLLVLVCFSYTGCGQKTGQLPAGPPAGACAVALTHHEGSARIDREIVDVQDEARKVFTVSSLERLGWLFVAKARISYDTGFYKLAEQCAACIESKSPRSPGALLLRGHVLHNLHRFKEGEKVARELVALRGSAFDHGLLGDVLMEQGRLLEAADAYQRMVNLRPGLQSYSRAAHLRWLKGDLGGARELMRMAAGAGSSRDPESIAWVYSRLALYELQAGNAKQAASACDSASSFVTDYAPALLIRGRLLLAQGNGGEAAEALKKAHAQNPLPEYAWAYADALRAAGRREEANSIEEQLSREGPASDPRTFSIYLATRGKDVETALRLAEDELRARADVFTLDAVAWSLAAAGRLEQARSSIQQALSHGTLDARLFFHAGVIAAASGQKQEARHWLDKAASIRQMLLPSEREALSKQLASL
jgi:tetratricopeptide (TPR) repeat protein